jgi:hypothetical protein
MSNVHPIRLLTLEPRPKTSNRGRAAAVFGPWGEGGGWTVRFKALQNKETYGLTVLRRIYPYMRMRTKKEV